MRTTVIVPDATRPLDIGRVLPPLLRELGGDVTVLVALGLHRPMTDDELAPLRNACQAAGATLLQHDAAAVKGVLARHVTEADALVTVGVVEPHQYAGFSGGIKGIAIGCASAAAIAQSHSLPMLRACGARVGWLDGNPFQDALWERAAGLPPIRGIFSVPGHDELFDGPVEDAFRAAVDVSRELHFTPHPEVGSMLLRVPESKAVNFYQASRAATYAALVDRPAIAAGGTLYVEAACPEGIGSGAGERACAEAMALGRDELLRQLFSPAPPITPGGAQRAYVLAMALERCDIVLVGAEPIPELAALGITQQAAAPEVELVVANPFEAVPVHSSKVFGKHR